MTGSSALTAASASTYGSHWRTREDVIGSGGPDDGAGEVSAVPRDVSDSRAAERTCCTGFGEGDVPQPVPHPGDPCRRRLRVVVLGGGGGVVVIVASA